MSNRTPAQTLEKLAQVAPNLVAKVAGWGGSWSYVVGSGEYRCLSDLDDIANGAFTAWCKKQLRERGWAVFALDEPTGEICCAAARHIATPEGEELTATCPTEWQAVAECLIQVLEKENA